jgi:hypothetical protein
MLNMRSTRLWCMNTTPINYVKLQTSTNNPNISAKMRYAQIVNTKNSKTVNVQNVQRTIAPLTN